MNKKFSFRGRLQSFHFAFEGVISFFKTEHNAWLHLTATIIAIFFTALLPCTQTEILFIVFAAGLVWTTELFNTAIERLADLTTTEAHPKIKFIKDISAAAVLITALTALITGCIVFIPKFY